MTKENQTESFSKCMMSFNIDSLVQVTPYWGPPQEKPVWGGTGEASYCRFLVLVKPKQAAPRQFNFCELQTVQFLFFLLNTRPCLNYRAKNYTPVSIEFEIECPPVHQTPLIQGYNLSPCSVYIVQCRLDQDEKNWKQGWDSM